MKINVNTITLIFLLSFICYSMSFSKDLPVRVVIDPGHPSENGLGARTKQGIREVDLNWEFSTALRDALSQNNSFQLVLTKQSDAELVTNRRRAEIANEASASLMLRIHCDSGRGHGLTLYYPSDPGKLGADEGPPMEICSASALLAIHIQSILEKRLQGMYQVNPLRTDRQTAIGSRQGALTGSIFSRVPVVTVELGYLDNPVDVAFMTASSSRNLLVEALAEAIRSYTCSPSNP
ncbi:N-acetylmuramoyl-L-alanine amidase [Candidatus Ozemobacteraceae bacterium]|nr:N-acetylmuramoyl-L-alanine amidase [Candidatus Ozemobacteraceae bacterium]